MTEPGHLKATYNDIHKLIKQSAAEVSEFQPNLFIAIGGGGFFPARVLRTFLKDASTRKNIPIHAIGLSLYEPVPGTSSEKIGTEVVRTQWLASAKILLGKRVLIIDEIDDSRKTLQYAVSELQKDVDRELAMLPESERPATPTEFAVFVVHNKRKEKTGQIPRNVPYYAAQEIDPVWLDYPWEAKDIDEHDRLVQAQNPIA